MKATGKILKSIEYVALNCEGVDRVIYNEYGQWIYTDCDLCSYSFENFEPDSSLLEKASDEACVINGGLMPSVFTIC